MTCIVVTRTGGFAGITRTTEVSDPDAVDRILVTLRDRAGTGAPPRRDGFVYEFTVESEAATAETYSVPEAELPAAVRALLR